MGKTWSPEDCTSLAEDVEECPDPHRSGTHERRRAAGRGSRRITHSGDGTVRVVQTA
jgi:hypothetical protein